MAYLRIALRKNLFIDSLAEYFKNIMKMLNVSISSFIILNLVSKGIFDFHVTTATDIYMYMEEVLRSCFRKALKALILTIIVLNLVSKGLFFTILSYYRTLNVVQDSAI